MVSLKIGATVPSSPVNVSSSVKEEDSSSFPGRKASPAVAESGLRGVGRGGLSNQSSASIPLTSGSSVSSNTSLGSITSGSEITKKNILGADERLQSSGSVQPLASPLGNRMIMSQVSKTSDAIGSTDAGNIGEATSMTSRVFSSPMVPGMQWRPGSSFQNQNEVVCCFIDPVISLYNAAVGKFVCYLCYES